MLYLAVFLLVLFPAPALAIAEAPSFSDVPQTREEFAAVEDLKRRGILEGRPDGTFGPDAPVNRAEAVTVIVRAVANVKNLPPFRDCFPDVQSDAWYVGTVCYAHDLEWVKGYPDGMFQPVRAVSRIEFLKILLEAYGIDMKPMDEHWRITLARDAANPSEWYVPFLAYAVATGMTRVDSEGRLSPGAALTRGQVALLLHRFLLYREGARDQALLTEAEKDVRFAFSKLEALLPEEAEFAVHRIRLRAFGALERLPESSLIHATQKLGEALERLARAYILVKSNDLATALQTTKEAYGLADEADGLSPDIHAYTDRIRALAHELAEAIRAKSS